jgi:hypothetical protein
VIVAAAVIVGVVDPVIVAVHVHGIGPVIVIDPRGRRRAVAPTLGHS